MSLSLGPDFVVNDTVPSSGTQALQAGHFVWRDAAQALPILNRATEVIGEKGFGQASLRLIAQGSNFSSAAVYYYFRNKEELLFAIIRRGLLGVIDRVRQAVQSAASPQEKLYAVVFGSLAYHIENFNEFKVLFKESNSLEGEYAAEVQRLRDDYIRMVNAVIDEYLQETLANLPEVTPAYDAWRKRQVYYMIGLISSTVMNRRRIQGGSPGSASVEMLARELHDLYLNGMLFETRKAYLKNDH